MVAYYISQKTTWLIDFLKEKANALTNWLKTRDQAIRLGIEEEKQELEAEIGEFGFSLVKKAFQKIKAFIQ